MSGLSRRMVDAAMPKRKDYVIWDDELPGFGLRVFSTGNCLIPQLVNARRFGAELTSERILGIEAACLGVEAFRAPEG
jgi:hypothetical protein